MTDPVRRFLERRDEVLHEGRLGLLCNQSSFDPEAGEYLFESLDRRGNLLRLFVPEHGLFGELQDQVPLGATAVYRDLGLGAEIVPLYGETEDSLRVAEKDVRDLDALIVDVQDVGSRYYTFQTTLGYVLESLASMKKELIVFVIDRPNPAGRQVEGSPLEPPHASFVGSPGLPHRHGLTIGELARFHLARCSAPVDLSIVELRGDERPSDIPASPNMPGRTTALVYSGQCLLEGTNLSEGRGTTRPFEIFGAPYLGWIARTEPPPAKGAKLRRTRFVPTFHKHCGELCHGYQIHLGGEPYHSLSHSLRLIRWIRENSSADFAWREGAYEFRSDRPAIELLAGDPLLLDYLHGRCSLEEAERWLEHSEEEWIRTASRWTLYDEPLRRA
ncbi:MAG: DUF1343 domain-containing protein [Planctomycetota bacterium]